MLRRLAPLLIALGVGLIGLALGLAALHRLFGQERAAAAAQVEDRAQAVQAYATELLRKQLQEALAQARSRTSAAVADPLLEAGGLYFRDVDGQVRLPRPLARAAAEPSGLREELRLLSEDGALPASAAPAGEPWGERLALARRLRAALRQRDAAGVTSLVRELLLHRVRYRLSVTREVASTLVAVEDLQRLGSPEPSLLSGLLRDGIRGSSGSFVTGLQRLVLQDRSAFTQEELQLLAARLAAAAQTAGVRADDFLARVRETDSPPSFSPAADAALRDGWLLQAGSDGTAHGVQLELPAALEALTTQLRARNLLSAEETLERVSTEPTLAALSLRLRSPPAERALADLASRHALKTGLLGACGLFGLAIAALSLRLRERQQRYVELKSDFVSTVSHELRTPLASMRVMAETLERRLEGAQVPGTRDYPARIVGEVDRLSFLVENILAFNRIDKGRWAARLSPVPLSEVVSRALAEASAHAPGGVELATRNLGTAVLQADAELLVILFGNLARNACTYNQRSPVQLAVAARRESDCWVVELTDNGVGIPAEEREKVFGEFYRVNSPVSAAGGSGLGLAICRRIMELHRGQIRVATSSMEGTTFELRFPALTEGAT